ncbi:hypothetical protein QVD17_31012 [Tagetes erecta]|uniref:Scarecrow-like protein 8 n=1 Tax=Tagetes erecta TaxID=13708 RepID=A0AAD8K5D2_TARER|nr:hypothetical protein QVD17_31012 [Tagetes erecta]
MKIKKPNQSNFAFTKPSLISKNSHQCQLNSLSTPNSSLFISSHSPENMSSGFPGDYFNINMNMNMNINMNNNGRSISMMNLSNNNNNNNNNLQNTYRSPLAGILADASSNIGLRRPDLIGKRSLAEFQHHQQLQQQAAFFLRNVKHRPVSFVDFAGSPEISSVSNTTSLSLPRYGVPVRPNPQSFNFHNHKFSNVCNLSSKQGKETEGKMMKRLQELEKELLLDDEGDENDVSGVTNSEWSETIQNILGSTPVTKSENIFSPSPTSSSSSSSCASSSASPATSINPHQLFSDAAAAISDGKHDTAVEILSRCNHLSNALGSPEQRMCFYMVSALRSRINMNGKTSSELYGKDHILSTQLLYDKSLCFKLAFMAANAAIVEAGEKIHIVDFDIGQGLQYVYLLHEIGSMEDKTIPISLKLTTFTDFGNGGVERLNHVGEKLKSIAVKLGVEFSFRVLNMKLADLDTTSLKVENDDVLVVNFGFKLYKLPDESVTTENLRDEVLRRVKGLSPALVILLEQELNGNTASFETRVSQVYGYYSALMESIEATMSRDNSERVKLEEGVSRKMVNSVACEGRERVERCEVFGKWRARMSMAGFELKQPSQLRADSLVLKLNSVTRGNPGFTVKEDGGGISFGWMGRTLTVASAWN